MNLFLKINGGNYMFFESLQVREKQMLLSGLVIRLGELIEDIEEYENSDFIDDFFDKNYERLRLLAYQIG